MPMPPKFLDITKVKLPVCGIAVVGKDHPLAIPTKSRRSAEFIGYLMKYQREQREEGESQVWIPEWYLYTEGSRSRISILQYERAARHRPAFASGSAEPVGWAMPE